VDESVAHPAPFLSIVIPAYNEEARLPGTLDRVCRYVHGRPFPVEVVVVDDGSRDGTAAVVERIAQGWPALRLVRNPGNRGKGYSVRNGMLHATGENVLFSDADLSAPIEEVEKLLGKMREGYDVVIGSRALQRELIDVHQSWFRENAGKIFNLFVRLLVGLPFRDTQCGFKIFRREAARAVFPLQQIYGFGFDAEVLYLAKRAGFRIAEIPVRWSHVEGTKVSMYGDSMEMFTDLLRIRWYELSGRYQRSGVTTTAAGTSTQR
jgi:dolichyl-phosphate beta-glucosyltransferase